MGTQSLLRAQFANAHEMLTMAIADCPEATLHHCVPGSTIQSPAAIFAHAVIDEDFLVQGMMQGTPLVYATGGWAGRTGVDFPASPLMTAEWAASVKLDPGKFGAYTKAVWDSTDAFIAGLSDEGLAREVDTELLGRQSISNLLWRIALWHVQSHQGEISALRGIRGEKGLPF